MYQASGHNKSRFHIWFFAVLSLIVFAVIVWKVIDRYADGQVQQTLSNINGYVLTVSVLLIPLNYGLEAMKWKVLTASLKSNSLFQSLKVVLMGQSLNMILPFAAGDLYVRYQQLESQYRPQSLGAILINRMAQMLPTLVFGLISVVYWVDHTWSDASLISFVSAYIAITIASIILFRRIKNTLLDRYLVLLRDARWQMLLKVLMLAFLRYFVFSLQYLIVFKSLGVEWTWPLCLGIFWVFLIKTIIPALTLFGDLAKRQLSAVVFFPLVTDQIDVVVVVGFVVWLMNIALPSALGLLYLPKLRDQ